MTTKTPKASYKLVGVHPEDLADGRMVEPGQMTALTSDQAADPHNKRLIDEGIFLLVDGPTKEA
jgi:hypothetical protein